MHTEILKLTKKYSKIMAGGILTAIGSGLVVFFAGLFTDITQLKAQVQAYQDDRSYNEKRFEIIDKKFDKMQDMIKDIHYFLIEKRKK